MRIVRWCAPLLLSSARQGWVECGQSLPENFDGKVLSTFRTARPEIISVRAGEGTGHSDGVRIVGVNQ